MSKRHLSTRPHKYHNVLSHKLRLSSSALQKRTNAFLKQFKEFFIYSLITI